MNVNAYYTKTEMRMLRWIPHKKLDQESRNGTANTNTTDAEVTTLLYTQGRPKLRNMDTISRKRRRKFIVESVQMPL